MATVWIPVLLRDLSNGQDTVEIRGATTIDQVIRSLDAAFPGMRQRLCSDDSLLPGISVAVDTHVATLGLRQPVHENSEVHFLPAISGG
jgi:molybdopterin converting factor small subunit